MQKIHNCLLIKIFFKRKLILNFEQEDESIISVVILQFSAIL